MTRYPYENILKNNTLFLQGPIGPYFSKISKQLKSKNIKTYHISFNGGDMIFNKNLNNILFDSSTDDFQSYLIKFIKHNNIKYMVMFNDCRYFHVIAKEVSKILNIELYIFEEGYIRPNFITFEKKGINGYSKLSKMPISEFKNYNDKKITSKNYNFFNFSTTMMIYYFIKYYIYIFLYPKINHHHRHTNLFLYLKYYILHISRKWYYKIKDYFKINKFIVKYFNKYYLVPLQVGTDTQIKVHSNYNNMYEFIDDVLYNFSIYANSLDKIIIKHHPMDRGIVHYGVYIKKLSIKYDIEKRVKYIHEGDLGNLIKLSKAVITINSTVGFSALYHGKPLLVLGNAFYKREEFTYNLSLKSFFKLKKYKIMDIKLFRKFYNYIIENCQINDSFYN